MHFPEIECPPLSMTPVKHAVQTPQQHVEKPIVTHKTQSITIGNNRHKGTNNSVADAIKRVSPLSQRPTEDVTLLHVLSDSIPVDQSCLDSVQTEANKDGTLQQPWNCQATQSTRRSQQQGLSKYEVPTRLWKRLGIDLFEWNHQRYLLIADYYSHFSVLRSVNTMSAYILSYC